MSFSFPPCSLVSLSAPNPCAQVDGRSPCSHLCLINFNQTFSCACPHLMKLQPDKRTCKGEEVHKQLQAELKPCVNCHDIHVIVQQQTASMTVLECFLMASAAGSAPRQLCQLSSHMTVNLIACLLSPPSIPLCFYFHFSSCWANQCCRSQCWSLNLFQLFHEWGCFFDVFFEG